MTLHENRKKKPQISPLRCASVEMTKGKGDGSIESGCWTEAFFITLGGSQAHDSSGEMTKFVTKLGTIFLGKKSLHSHKLVISTGAYPDFLPRSTGNDRVCGFQ
jgi:hypothetical protein